MELDFKGSKHSQPVTVSLSLFAVSLIKTLKYQLLKFTGMPPLHPKSCCEDSCLVPSAGMLGIQTIVA